MILLRPEWLWALIPLVLAGWVLWGRLGSLGGWEQAADPELLQAMAELGQIEPAQRHGPFWAALATLALIIVALSGPAIERRDAPSFRNLDGVLFVIDVSDSMTEDPRWVQMLTMARFGINALGTRPAGVIVFAGDAYVATDMTHDHMQLGQSLFLLDAQTVPDAGSRPDLGLTLALDRLQQAEVIAGDVVLFTDGAGLGAASRRMAQALADQGARLSLVAMQDSPVMQDHAAAGQGRVFQLSEVEPFDDWLAEDARQRLEEQSFPLLFWSDLGRYVLVLSMLPLLLLFRRVA